MTKSVLFTQLSNDRLEIDIEYRLIMLKLYAILHELEFHIENWNFSCKIAGGTR